MPKAKEKVVISIGGSVFLSDQPGYSIGKLAKVIAGLSSKMKLYIVVGGGRISRFYIEQGRDLGLSERRLDELGIAVTRLNARILCAVLGRKSNPTPADDVKGAISASKKYPVVVMGGTEPGHTTDAVAAMLAEKAGASRVVNATSVDGVYTSDPMKNASAKRYARMSFKELVGLTRDFSGYAGPNIVFDPKGVRILKRIGVPLLVVKGTDLESLRNAILGRAFDGTVVE
jgi:uridylate kinase